MKYKLIYILLLLTFSFSLKATELFEKKQSYGLFDNLGWSWWSSNDVKETEIKNPNVKETEIKNPNPFTKNNLDGIEAKLKKSIVGQDKAIKMIVSHLEAYAYGLNKPKAPIASLLFMGPTGVGKTQLAKELARLLLGSEQALITFNMSDYSSPQSMTKLTGMSMGFYASENGELTEALQKSPYGIVVLDEIDKATPELLNILKPIFTQGYISNATKNNINCTNYIFILNTSLEADNFFNMQNLGYSDDQMLKSVQTSYLGALSPGLYRSLQPVIFNALKKEEIKRITYQILSNFVFEVKSKQNIDLYVDESVIEVLNHLKLEPTLGAFEIKEIIRKKIGHGLIEALKQNYLEPNDEATISYYNNNLIIQNIHHTYPFKILWEVNNSNEPSCPFNFSDLLELEEKLNKKILGQPEAVKITVSALIRYATGIRNSNAPIASLLYLGPSGVGKTQLAKELCIELLGSESHLIRLDMSEYSENLSMTSLIGSPFGLIDSEKGGILTEALKKHPYAVVLLDEVEKAHPSILKTFLQVFDEGKITDARGIGIDCRNVIFILTSNLGSQKILDMHKTAVFSNQEILEAIQTDVIKTLSSELYNRLEAVTFLGLGDDVLEQLILQMLNEVKREIQRSNQIQIEFDSTIVSFLKKNGFNYSLGARPLKRLIQNAIITTISNGIINNYLKSGDEVKISYNPHSIIMQNANRREPFMVDWQIPIDKDTKSPFHLENLIGLEEKLNEKILGQPEAVKVTTSALMRYAAGIRSSNAPIATLLYLGPTGVGKTQLAKELCKELLGNESHLIHLNMSEYSEQYTITRLIGSPPSLGNHEEGGQLTEALKKHPYSIVLLDEIEKAHLNVLKVFLQVFDEGQITDAKGILIDCTNVIFILTSNLAYKNILEMHQTGNYSENEILDIIQTEVIETLTPELYNRLEPIAFMGLNESVLEKLIIKMLTDLKNDFEKKKNIRIDFDDTILEFLKQNGFNYMLGARPLKRLIQTFIITPVAKEIVKNTIRQGDSISLSVFDGKLFITKI
jgi:ATP-dependent Clp protease ATP-binding subunit ClpA